MKTAAVILCFVVGILALTWIIQGNDFFMYKYFGLKYENTRRQIFEQSRAFNQGMVQELDNMRFEYLKADPAHKKALASIIIHRASGYNLNDPIVPEDLRAFILDLRRDYASS